MAKLSIHMASVKVMRSYDYCHFEVNLSASVDGEASEPSEEAWLQQVDNLRKHAARLADKAVEQYRVAKASHAYHANKLRELEEMAHVAAITPEIERTPGEKAAIKALADFHNQARYDYEDDWQE